MFHNLVESCAQQHELARRGKFFLGTLAMYALLLLVGGVASIYAFDAHLGRQNLELIVLVNPNLSQPAADQPAPVNPSPAAATNGGNVRPPYALRTHDRPDNPNNPPREISTAPHDAPPTLPNLPVVRGDRNENIGAGGGSIHDGIGIGGDSTGGGSNTGRSNGALVRSDPPPPIPTPTPAPQTRTITRQVLNGMAIYKPAPPYPSPARAINVSGVVTVQILVDEQGRVIQARAVSGHPFLRQAAVGAAYQARFTPTTLGGQPVRVSGTITYNFVLQ